MLGKLLKHDFKNTYKLMLVLYAAFAAVTLLGVGSILLPKAVNSENEWLGVLVGVVYVLSVLALFVITFVYICTYVYKTMYSKQGYLTHTLPATEVSIFNAKLISSFVWLLLTVLILYGSISLVARVSPNVNINIENDPWVVVNGAEILAPEIGLFKKIVFTTLFVVFGLLCFVLWIFTSLSVGQLSDNHKTGAAIVTGAVIYFLTQIVGVVMIVFTVLHFQDASTTEEIRAFANLLLAEITVFCVVFSGIMYCICLFINKRKLNLE